MIRFVSPLIAAFSLALCLLTTSVARAADPAAYVATLEEFPPANAGVDLAGELVTVDHVNRRGGLRLDGDFSEDRYHSAPTFSFLLMPYGTVSYHGAPADLHDVPLGTRLVGRFVLPPAGDTAIAPVPPQHKNYVPEHNRAIRLEDDFSHDVRTGRAWKLQAFDRDKDGVLKPEELDLAQAAFRAYDPAPRADEAAAAAAASGGGGASASAAAGAGAGTFAAGGAGGDSRSTGRR